LFRSERRVRVPTSVPEVLPSPNADLVTARRDWDIARRDLGLDIGEFDDGDRDDAHSAYSASLGPQGIRSRRALASHTSMPTNLASRRMRPPMSASLGLTAGNPEQAGSRNLASNGPIT
jgi:hypothetical protein